MTYTGAGFVLFTPDFRVLLVQDAKSKKWGFPKGHREEVDESDVATAQRELQEETGISPISYTIYEHPFRIIRGSASYIFRYAILNTMEYLGEIQNHREIAGLQWVSLVQFYLNPECVVGNKYLRTWISDIVSHADRKSYLMLQTLIQRVFGDAATATATAAATAATAAATTPPVSLTT
jgi:8-oxo-dGTP pyrophosphatase MutT (NUDIX family)